MILYTSLAFLCSIAYSISAILCKIGLQSRENIRDLPLRTLILFLCTNRWWIIGVLLSGIANVAMIQIQSRLDVSIVFSFLNFSYILVLILGHCFLRERLSKEQWLGVGAVTIGTLMLLAVQNPQTGNGTDQQDLAFFTAFSLSAVMVLAYTIYRNRGPNYEVLAAICAGICFGCVETYLKASTNLVVSENGFFSIIDVDSIKYFLTGWPFFVMFAFGAVGWLFLQLTYSHGHVSVTIPIIAVTQRISSIASGYFVFDEIFSILRILGVFAILLGVLILVCSTIDFDDPQTA